MKTPFFAQKENIFGDFSVSMTGHSQVDYEVKEAGFSSRFAAGIHLLPLETGYFSSAALCSKQCDSPPKGGWG